MTINLGFVIAEFNRDLTYQMELLGEEHAKFLGATVKEKILVPGVSKSGSPRLKLITSIPCFNISLALLAALIVADSCILASLVETIGIPRIIFSSEALY
jgi:hypothetical protein